MTRGVCDSARTGRAFELAFVLAGGVVVACAGDGVTRQARAAAVRANLEGQGLTVQGVQCPDAAGQPETDPVTCSAQIGEVTLAMAVAADPDGSGLTVHPLGPAVVVAAVVPDITRQVESAGIAVADITCDAEVWVAASGTTQRCEIVDRTGRTLTYEATFSGQGSDHTMRLFAKHEGETAEDTAP